MKIDESVPLTIFQDENRVGQILVNIIGNAVKYTFNGQVSIVVETSHQQDEIRIIIKDSGKGIDKLSRVGQWFGNLDIIENVNQNGIGFGITISKKIAEKLGGKIHFQNVISNSFNDSMTSVGGLQVTISLPCNKVKSPFESKLSLGNFEE